MLSTIITELTTEYNIGNPFGIIVILALGIYLAINTKKPKL